MPPDHPEGKASQTTLTAQAAVIQPAGRLPRTRAEQLAENLETRIRQHRLEPGASVGTLELLREETGFAYSTVSEAVRLLRDRGVLEIRPGRRGGLFVADRGPVVRLRHTLLRVADDATAVADAIELRDHLEYLVDISAARFRTDDDIADLQSCLFDMKAASDWDGLLRANWTLHERIAAIAPNAMARAIYVSTLGPLQRATSQFDCEHPAEEYRNQRIEIHSGLVESIAAGDEAAVRQFVVLHNAANSET